MTRHERTAGKAAPDPHGAQAASAKRIRPPPAASITGRARSTRRRRARARRCRTRQAASATTSFTRRRRRPSTRRARPRARQRGAPPATREGRRAPRRRIACEARAVEATLLWALADVWDQSRNQSARHEGRRGRLGTRRDGGVAWVWRGRPVCETLLVPRRAGPPAGRVGPRPRAGSPRLRGVRRPRLTPVGRGNRAVRCAGQAGRRRGAGRDMRRARPGRGSLELELNRSGRLWRSGASERELLSIDLECCRARGARARGRFQPARG